MPVTDADVVVVGGGLAGVAAVQSALEVGREVLWIDDGAPRASDTPVALIHPFAGGSFRPRKHAAEAWREALQWFDSGRGATSQDASATVHHAVLRRVVQPGPRGDRLRNSWPHAEVTARSLFPRVMSSQDGSWFDYGPVMGVDLSAVLAARRARFQAASVAVLEGRVDTLAAQDGGWEMHTATTRVRARSVVVAAGVGAVALLAPLLPCRDLVRAEGVLAHASTSMPAERFVVSGGHVSHSPSRLAWGATYRMLDAARPDMREHDTELRKIDARLRLAGAVMPALEDAQRWTGVRLVDARTREPWVGQPRPGLHLFTAFGSQGGLWIPWHARRLARALAARGTAASG